MSLKSFIKARFARGEYLGLHLTIAFLVSALALWIFLGITEDVLHNDPSTQFDSTLLAWMQAHHGPAADQIFRALSAVGSPLVIIILAVGVAGFLGISEQGLLVERWLLAFAGGFPVHNILKKAVRPPRPLSAAGLYHSWSLP